MKKERLLELEKFIDQNGLVTIDELCDQFQVSLSTIRRDLDALAAEKSIQKVYGGARSIKNTEEGSFLLKSYEERHSAHALEKQIIAKQAASFIEENDIIFIDTGSSTVPIMDFLRPFHHITVITNSILVLLRGLEYPNLTVVGLPGLVKSKTASLVGASCLEAIEAYNSVLKSFMACSAIDLTHGASNSSLDEFEIKKKIIAYSRMKYLLVDSSKFDHVALKTFAEIRDFDGIITDSVPRQDYVQYCDENQVRLYIASV
ncbi:DeoR/GlpR family DNA-binding transcription regulator [uncultured Murdochiella sp.]|uniref:DeoR/GlpR family DNA-binding transcription regulator n=1 Tax=uncultured Murdochiella sp. TaxID=1586095 RepID=UPI0028055065|nr:DeoR/GlpR family DNA-binding transcription regulator [uncultured Murdochiella sp.]